MELPINVFGQELSGRGLVWSGVSQSCWVLHRAVFFASSGRVPAPDKVVPSNDLWCALYSKKRESLLSYEIVAKVVDSSKVDSSKIVKRWLQV